MLDPVDGGGNWLKDRNDVLSPKGYRGGKMGTDEPGSAEEKNTHGRVLNAAKIQI